MEIYINVREFIGNEKGKDVSKEIQSVIDENPNRVLFFPDGEYLIGEPILTPADPQKSVSLKLSDFAIIRATDTWNSDEAMVRLGGKDSANIIEVACTNYGIEGGIIDCQGVAKGISVDSGRETYIRNVSIKNAMVGIHIKDGINNGSSDADVSSVNITCNDSRESVGLLINGSDNTFTNIRIGRVFTGVVVSSGGNMLRNVHPLYYITSPTYPDYSESTGFLITSKSRHNWFDYCYSDNFATGFKTLHGGGVIENCFAFWYSKGDCKHVGLESPVPFRGRISGYEIGGKCDASGENKFSENLILADEAIVEGVFVDSRQ